MNAYKYWLSITLVLSISACGGGSESSSSPQPTSTQNAAPTANAGEDQTVNEQTTVTLIGSGIDSDGTIASYAWTQISGTDVTLSGSSSTTVSFEAPTTTEQLSLTFELEVTDDDAAKSVDSVIVTVNPVNSSPIIVLVTEEKYLEHQPVTLNAESSTDEDGDITSYFWEQTSGLNLSLQNETTATVSFLVDDITSTQNYSIKLTITDNENTSSVKEVSFDVEPVNRPPISDAGPDQSVLEQNNFLLDGTASYDLDGPIFSYQWSQLSGPSINISNGTEKSINLTAPIVAQDEKLIFQLNVSDSEGLVGTDEVVITVTNEFNGNSPPLISGETKFNVNSGSKFVFEPTVEDIDSSNLNFSWTQLTGTAASLSNSSTKNLIAQLPTITNNEELTFLLTVSDEWHSVTETFKLLVNAPPQIIISERFQANEKTNVVLDASQTTDATSGTLSYVWQQTFGKAVALSSPNTSSPSFTAPETLTTDSSKFLKFKLTVTDQEGASSFKDITVNVVPVNSPPTVEFHAKNEYKIGEAIILNPTITDEDGTVGTATWNLLHFSFGNGTSKPTANTNYKGYFVNDVNTSTNEFKPFYTHVFAEQNSQPAGQLTFELSVMDNELEVVKSYHTVTFTSPFDVYSQGYEFEEEILDEPIQPEFGDVFYENWGGTAAKDIILNTPTGLYWFASTNEGYENPEYLNITSTTLTKLSVNDIDNDGDADIVLFDPMKVSRYDNLLQQDLDERLEDGIYLIENNQSNIIQHLIITKTDFMNALNETGPYGNTALLVKQMEVVDFDQDGLKDILLLANYSDSSRKGNIYFIGRQANGEYSAPALVLQGVNALFDSIGVSKGLYVVFTDDCPDTVNSLSCENNYKKQIDIYENNAGQLILKDTIIEPASNSGWMGIAGYVTTKDYEGILLNKHTFSFGYEVEVIKNNEGFDFANLATPLLQNLSRDLPFIGDINQDGFDDFTYVQIDNTKQTAFIRSNVSQADGSYTTALIDSFPYPYSFVLFGMKFKESTLLINNPISNQLELTTFIAEPISYNLTAHNTLSHSTFFTQGFHRLRSLVNINDKILVSSQCSNNITEFNVELGYSYNQISRYFTNPQQLVKGDFNEDGNEDLMVLSQTRPTYSCLSIKTINRGALYFFESNSDGTFKQPAKVTLNGTKSYRTIKVEDLNNDGHLDLVMSGENGESGNIFLGHGNGSFILTDLLPGYWFPNSNGFEAHTEIVDLDDDKDLDIVFGTQQGLYQVVYIYKNSGNGEFTEEQVLREDAAGFSPSVNIVVMDIENDGDIDIVGLKSRTEVDDNRIGLFVMLNTNGQFELKMLDLKYASGVNFSPSSKTNFSSNNLLSFDIDNDGFQDIVTPHTFMLNNQQGGFHDYIVTNNSTGAVTYDQFGQYDSIFTLDFDKDGDLDVIKMNSGRIVVDINRAIP